MDGRDLVVVGASAGGVRAVRQLIGDLPASLRAAVLVVLHRAPQSPGYLAQHLNKSGTLPAKEAVDGEALVEGRVYVAPPDRHLLVEPGRVRVTRGPRENGFRPAVDPLFRTAARAYNRRVVAVVLSGALDDGSNGVAVVRRHGGVTIAQDPLDAEVPAMPLNAIRTRNVDHVLPLAKIGALIQALVVERVPQLRVASSEAASLESEASMKSPHVHENPPPGPPTVYRCPECGGALWELGEKADPRFLCHVGHAFASDNLMEKQDGQVEAALWTALRQLEERTALRKEMALRAHRGGLEGLASTYEAQAMESENHAQTLREVLGIGPSGETEQSEPPKRRPVRARRR